MQRFLAEIRRQLRTGPKQICLRLRISRYKNSLTAPGLRSLAGRGNRIAGGQFTLDGTAFQLPKTDGPNCLRGGNGGFNKQVRKAVDRSRAGTQVLELT